MSAPASPANAPAAAAAAAAAADSHSIQYNDEQGSITLPNGKEYAVTHLRLHGQDLIGGAADRNSSIKTLSAEQRKALFNILEAIVSDEKLSAELNEKEFDAVNFSFGKDENDADENAISVTVVGRVQNAANAVFNLAVKSESIQKSHEALFKVFPKPPKIEEPNDKRETKSKELDEKHSSAHAAGAKKKKPAAFKKDRTNNRRS